MRKPYSAPRSQHLLLQTEGLIANYSPGVIIPISNQPIHDPDTQGKTLEEEEWVW